MGTVSFNVRRLPLEYLKSTCVFRTSFTETKCIDERVQPLRQDSLALLLSYRLRTTEPTQASSRTGVCARLK